MRLTAEQQAKAVEYLGGPCRIEQAARLLAVPYADFAASWTEGRADAERGADTDAGQWYLACQQARARYVATTRSQAQAVAGSRESSDLLALALTIENDEGPLASDDADVRQRSPLLRWSDRMEEPGANSELRRIGQDYQRSAHALFSAMLADDVQRRGAIV
jgi:hypothetical protein